MAGVAHLGVGLAAKGAFPRTPLWALIAASYAIDIVFGVFWLLGVERVPRGAGQEESTGGGRVPAPDVQGPGAGNEGTAGRGFGLDAAAEAGTDPPAPWSHGLLMATVWSTLAGVLAWRVSRRPGTGFVIGVVAFSHWIVDFITQPMTAVYPHQGKIPLLFGKSRKVGLGLYCTKTAVNVGEYGSLAVGATIYALTLRKLKLAKVRNSLPDDM